MWFFFHERGNLLQKSWEGLLRSIIYQLCRKSLQIGRLILPYYMQMLRSMRKTWSLSNLEACMARILDQDECDLNIVLFLDALDEYNDPPELIAEA